MVSFLKWLSLLENIHITDYNGCFSVKWETCKKHEVCRGHNINGAFNNNHKCNKCAESELYKHAHLSVCLSVCLSSVRASRSSLRGIIQGLGDLYNPGAWWSVVTQTRNSRWTTWNSSRTLKSGPVPPRLLGSGWIMMSSTEMGKKKGNGVVVGRVYWKVMVSVSDILNL